MIVEEGRRRKEEGTGGDLYYGMRPCTRMKAHHPLWI